MANIRFILFDEKVNRIIPYIIKEYSFLKLPVWGSLTVGSLLDVLYFKDLSFKAELYRWGYSEELIDSLMEDSITDRVLISRVSNISYFNYKQLWRIDIKRDEVIKFRFDKKPSDLYMFKKDFFIENLKKAEKNYRFTGDFFDNYVFNIFTRIDDIDGYTYLMRNTREYFTENLSLLDYIKNGDFVKLYSSVTLNNVSEALIGRNAEVIGSFIGAGSVIEGKVKNSIIFNDVYIGSDTTVENSVILPENKIGENCSIYNSLILIGNGRFIGNNTVIGRQSEKYDLSVVIGENISIPDGSKIGMNCIIYGNKEPESSIIVEDGEVVSLMM